MICEKTGAVIYLLEYDTHVRGDAYRVGDSLLVRVNNASRNFEPTHVHYYVDRVECWFDEEAHTGTLIASGFQYYGYEGKAT